MTLLFKMRFISVPKYLRRAFKIASQRPVKIQDIQASLENKCKNQGLSIFPEFNKIYSISRKVRARELTCNNLILAIVRELNKTSMVLAIQFAERYPPFLYDARFVKTLCDLYLRNGKPVLALNLATKLSDSEADQQLLDRIDKAFEIDIGNSEATLHFVKHNRNVTLNSSGYSLYLPSEHTQKKDSDDVMRLDGTLQPPSNAPLNCALITMKFFTKKGDAIELGKDSLLSQSSIVGPYQYINPEDDGTFSIEFKPPREFNHALITFKNWKNTGGVKLGPVLEIKTAIEHNSINHQIDDFERFCREVSGPVIFVYGSNQRDCTISLDRTSRLIENLHANQVPIINGFFRKNRNPIDSFNSVRGMLTLPVDFVNSYIDRLSEMDFGGREKVLLVSNPSPTLVRKIHLFNSNKWTVISDLNAWKGIEFDELTNGQLHLITCSNSVMVKNNHEKNLLSEICSPTTQIPLIGDGWIESKKKKTRPREKPLIGILPRQDDEIDFSLVAELGLSRPDADIDLFASTWPMAIPKPDNVKFWTVRDYSWAIERMLTWDIGVDFPLDSVSSTANGTSELRYNRIPCIVKANKKSSKTMPYIIRYNNFSQIGTAVDEAMIMDRTYRPNVNHKTWSQIALDIIEHISEFRMEEDPQMRHDYLPLSELIALAETRPPKMSEIKKQVQDAFLTEGLIIYRDLIWTLDYLTSNPTTGKGIVNNLLIASVRGIGAVDPYTAIELAENYQIVDKRISRTMITLYNRTDQYEKSMKLLEPMRNDSWKKKMKINLQKKLKYTPPPPSQEQFFPILPPMKRRKPVRDLKVACILDQFTFDSLTYEVDLHPVPKENWRDFLTEGDFDFFLAESIWKGHDEQWVWAMSSPNSPNGVRLQHLLEWCSEIGLKKVFWNKEDPVNYEKFIETAARFDVVFSSDNRSISRYIEDCGHDRIYSMPFASQPVIHNPVRNRLPSYPVCFAGSWYIREHGDRKRQTKLLVDASKEFDLHIYDRFFGTNDVNRFPEEYSNYVRGSIPYDECCMAYRAYKIFLNVNSVMNSDTMFSRRVFEILSSSTHVLSTPSEGMEKLLPNGITVVDSLSDAKEAINRLLMDDEERQKSAHLGYRHVMNNHTYSHRIGDMLEKIGIESAIESDNPLVSLVTCTNRPDMIQNIMHNFNRQIWENREIIIVIDCEEEDFERIQELLGYNEKITLHKVTKGLSLGHCFNIGMEISKGDYIAKFDDDDLYGPNYIVDQLLPFKYTDADIVGKLCTFMYHEKSEKTYVRFPNNRHKYGDLVLGPTFFFKREVSKTVKMRDLSKSEDTNFLKDSLEAGFKIYATDPYNFVYMRKKVDGFHTWDATDEELLKNAVALGSRNPEEYAFV